VSRRRAETIPADEHPITGPDGLPQRWTIEFYEDEHGNKPVLRWIKEALTPTKRRALGTAMRQILQQHGTDICSTEWGSHVAPKIMEFRLRMRGSQVINTEAEIHEIDPEAAKERFGLDSSEDILLRVFFTARGEKLVLLLHGYDKGESPGHKHQQKQIDEAAKRLNALEEREKADKKSARRGQNVSLDKRCAKAHTGDDRKKRP
jgi:phage-related protein